MIGISREIASVCIPQRVPWDMHTSWALFSLVGIWGALFALTWAHWGDLTVDCGREMYAAAQIAGGKTLYADVWYPYTPGGPYVNSVLLRLFGFQLSTLYWAGSLAALGSAIFLYLTSLHFVSRAAAWTTGTVLLIQSFVPGIFCFPLPYSFGAVYGCLCACLCLWLMVNACASFRRRMDARRRRRCFGRTADEAGDRRWLFRRAGASGHPEGHEATFVSAGGCRCGRSVAGLPIVHRRDLLDDLAPGAEFLTQENLMSWPTSYFMRRYGALWLSTKGLEISWNAFLFRGVASVLIATVFWIGFRMILVRYGHRRWLFWAALLALIALLVLGSQWEFLARGARWLLFPPAAPFLITVMMPVAAWLCWRNRLATGFMQAFLLFSLAGCVSLRILFRMPPFGYAIYYNAPVLLSYFLILRWLLAWRVPALTLSSWSAALLPYLATLIAVSLSVLPLYKLNLGNAPLATERGVIYTTPQKAGAYRSALDFIQQHREPDATFLSVPEDMSLYFLAGISCPTRLYQFGPGVLAPGKMTTDFIQEIERKKVRYLIWSNRTFEEYGVPRFGVDFDQAVGEYFSAAYRPIRAIGDPGSTGWKAVVWERVGGAQSEGR